MTDSFDKMDERWMKDLKKVRDGKVPPKILEGFSASVEARIREEEKTKQGKVYEYKPRRFFIPVLVPTFAVLVIASAVVLRLPGTKQAGTPEPVTAVSHLSEEASALREVGAWSDEDEAAAGVLADAGLSDLEFS